MSMNSRIGEDSLYPESLISSLACRHKSSLLDDELWSKVRKAAACAPRFSWVVDRWKGDFAGMKPSVLTCCDSQLFQEQKINSSSDKTRFFYL